MMAIDQTKQEASVQERAVWLRRTEEALQAEHEAECRRRVIFQRPTECRAARKVQETEGGLFARWTSNVVNALCALRAKLMKPAIFIIKLFYNVYNITIQ